MGVKAFASRLCSANVFLSSFGFHTILWRRHLTSFLFWSSTQPCHCFAGYRLLSLATLEVFPVSSGTVSDCMTGRGFLLWLLVFCVGFFLVFLFCFVFFDFLGMRWISHKNWRTRAQNRIRCCQGVMVWQSKCLFIFHHLPTYLPITYLNFE